MESQPLYSKVVYYDYEAQEKYADEKLERSIRHRFIRKVYGIVLSQLLFTSLVAGFFTIYAPAGNWIVTRGFPVILSCGILAVVLCSVLFCFASVARNYPYNYIMLGAFTAAEAVGLGGLCAVISLQSKQHIVLAALFCTVVVVSALTLFAWQTKYDFSSWIPYVVVASLVLLLVGIGCAFFPKNRVVDILYAGAMTVLFSIYLLIDTQRIAGKGAQAISTEDYILASLSLYLNVINIFIYILRFLEKLTGNRDRE